MKTGPDIKGPRSPLDAKILTPDALNFLAKLHRTFNPSRLSILKLRYIRQLALDQGTDPHFLKDHSASQDPHWQIAPTPADLNKRWVEITGPTDRKMIINAMNSGADVFMADFEDANSPTWHNMIEGQHNLIEAIAGSLSLSTPEGKRYTLLPKTAVLMVRPRGLHLDEAHLQINGEPCSASLFDFGLYFFHNVHALIKKGTAPYFYLPKLENHLEARFWNEVFIFAQEQLQIPTGTIRATVLLETILAAFEMEEILFELREHSAGLNAGRWDYIFSIIKKFQARPKLLFPDRSQITMQTPFMKAYAHRLVQICHKRGAHAIGGMSAFIPNRKDKVLNDLAMSKVEEDKLNESAQGFDGTWVAHPDLVPIAKEIFKKALQDKPNQKNLPANKGQIKESDLLDFNISGGKITEEGIRKNINITLQYLQAWLAGYGAVALYNLMEDAATAEISRAQLWQWIHHPNALLDDGRKITSQLYHEIADHEMKVIENTKNNDSTAKEKLKIARQILDQVVLQKQFINFMTSTAYDSLIKEEGINV